MYKKLIATIAAASALLIYTSACSSINEGDPCDNPGYQVCENANINDEIFTCTDEYEYHRTNKCSSSQQCREVGYQADCYDLCDKKEAGVVNYVHDGVRVTVETCEYMQGYGSSSPVWTYTSYPCNNPGTTICEGDYVYRCNSYYEYEVSDVCEVDGCRESVGQAACYRKCNPADAGTEVYTCNGDQISIESCTVFPGYEAFPPVFTYDRAITLCTDNKNYYACSAGELNNYSCPIDYSAGKKGICVQDEFSTSSIREAGCK